MECSCTASSNYDGEGSHWGRQYRKAAKEHKCFECKATIQKKEDYAYHTVFGDSVSNFKLCLSCDSLVNAFFNNGWMFGSVVDDLEEYLHENWQSDLPSSCISKLPLTVRNFVCDFLQEYQDK